jgi:hypothetical protein
LSTSSGSFTKQPGLAFGFLTGFQLYGIERNCVNLGVEFGFMRLIGYRSSIQHVYPEYGTRYVLSEVYDEQFNLSFVEIGLVPEFRYPITGQISAGIYLGASIGLGKENLTVRKVSSTVVDSTFQPAFPIGYGPYGEYNMGPYRAPHSFQAGMNFTWHRLMIDLRYKYTDMRSRQSYHPLFRNGFVLIGIVL